MLLFRQKHRTQLFPMTSFRAPCGCNSGGHCHHVPVPRRARTLPVHGCGSFPRGSVADPAVSPLLTEALGG